MNCPHCGKVIVVQLVKDDGKQAGYPERESDSVGSSALATYLEQINHDALSGKDADFAADMQKRYDQYGSRTMVSDKQLAWLKRLASGEKKSRVRTAFDEEPPF